MTVIRPFLVSVACAAALAACGGTDDPTPEEHAVDPSPSSSASASPSSDPVPTGPAGEAVSDLAARLGVEADAVEVVSVEEVTWRDGSRGCAEPGTMYTQALIDGARITLRADGTTYEYHSGGSRPPQLCEKPTE